MLATRIEDAMIHSGIDLYKYVDIQQLDISEYKDGMVYASITHRPIDEPLPFTTIKNSRPGFVICIKYNPSENQIERIYVSTGQSEIIFDKNGDPELNSSFNVLLNEHIC